jgi:excisionase family DNA binding protein
VRRLVHEKRIPYIKWGHLLRFDPTDIANWIDTYRRCPNGPGAKR